MPEHNLIQQHLFREITKKFSSRTVAMKDYNRQFPGSSPSNTRARFSATTTITYDHGMRVAAHYGLHDLDVWQEGWPDTHFNLTVSSLQSDTNAYLDMLIQDLKNIKGGSQTILHTAIGDVPLFIIKRYRNLAGFLLYFYFCYEANHPDYRNMAFGSMFLNKPNISKWLDRYRVTLETYQQIPGVEYWSPYMLDNLVKKINLILRIEMFEHAALIEVIKSELNQLVNELETVASEGYKLIGPSQKPAKVQIFNHEGFIEGTWLVIENLTHSIAYREHGHHNLFRYGANIAQQQLALFSSLGKMGGDIQVSSIARNAFFKKMRSQVGLLM